MTPPIKTLARTQTLKHPLGERIETPLLVPSFSSRGFPPREPPDTHVAKLFDTILPALTGSALISAYDIHYQQIVDPSAAPVTVTFPEMVILDSGGYEIGTLDDLSTPFHVPGNPQPWSLEFYEAVL
ncbi:MAG: hypothetical protein E6J91_10495, partial [Deltaproteobacteria bacterium]